MTWVPVRSSRWSPRGEEENPLRANLHAIRQRVERLAHAITDCSRHHQVLRIFWDNVPEGEQSPLERCECGAEIQYGNVVYRWQT
jgi:hypothetical protein